MRTTITNHGHSIYSLDIYEHGQLVRRISNLTSMAECRAEIERQRKQAAGLLILPGLDDLPTSAIVQRQTRLF